MNFLGDFLDKYRSKLSDYSHIVKAFQKAVQEITGVDIKESDIKYQRHKIILKTSPIIRSEVFISKERILNKIKEELGEGVVVDIK